MHLLNWKKILVLSICLLTIISVAYSQTKNYLIPANDSAMSISPNMIGFNNNMASKNEPWSDMGRLYSLEKSAVGLLRYPGGTVSNYWDMENQRLLVL